MTKRQLALIIKKNNFDNGILQDILEERTIIQKGMKLIIGDTHVFYYYQSRAVKKPVRVAGYWTEQKNGLKIFNVVDGARYFNGMLTHETVDKDVIVNPIFDAETKEYQFQMENTK